MYSVDPAAYHRISADTPERPIVTLQTSKEKLP